MFLLPCKYWKFSLGSLKISYKFVSNNLIEINKNSVTDVIVKCIATVKNLGQFNKPCYGNDIIRWLSRYG